MDFKNNVNKYLLGLITAIFLFVGVGCSDTSSSNNSAVQKNTTLTAQSQKQTKETAVKSPIKTEKAMVTRHVDGDTVYVKLENGTETKIRLIGVNTPESTTKHEEYGEEASNYTKSQLLGKTVYLEKDTSDTDKYGRLLRYVWLEQPTEINEDQIKTKMFNAILAINGYAEQSTYPPDVKYADYFKEFAAYARENNKGLWAINYNGTTKGDGIEAPSTSSSNSSSSRSSSSNNDNAMVQQNQTQQVSQSNNQTATVYVTNTGKKYHSAGCKYLRKSQISISLSDAKAQGYEPCSVCNPPQ